MWYVTTGHPPGEDLDVFMSDCAGTQETDMPPLGVIQEAGYYEYAGYTHTFPPNHVGCWNSPPYDEVYDGTTNVTEWAGIPATSEHRGGVNVGFCDGRLAFVSDAVDVDVWRAIGTINGEEVVNSEF
jgi:prepilin-type processing-associated H-X9-DG protein